jgi:hypothetical protein
MGWLSATNAIEQLQILNDSSPNIKVMTIEGVDGGQIVSDNALVDLDGYLIHFAEWYRSLPATNEFPKPKIRKKRNI